LKPAIRTWLILAGTAWVGIAFASQGARPSINMALLVDEQPYVIDGDTVVLRRTRVRISGIDAPDQPDYAAKAAAKRALISLVTRGGGLRCGATPHHISRKTGQPCRAPAASFKLLNLECTFIASGADVGRAMVSAGYSVDYRMFSGGRYQSTMFAARSAKRGLWGSAPAVMTNLAVRRQLLPRSCT
jgi:endonuclease YncB( thermonuclease family)